MNLTNTINRKDFKPEIRAELINYVTQEKQKENLEELSTWLDDESKKNTIVARFTKRINFGTAGLRGPMCSGVNAMNSVTVRHASQGLCQYYMNHLGAEQVKGRWICIGYDGRHNSRYFAHLTAAVFLSKGFKISIANVVTATPLCPFAVKRYSAVCGIQITASHNPKVDNGYKVYASNAVQIVPPMDREVQSLILQNTYAWPKVDELMNHDLKQLNTAHPMMANVCDMMWDLWPAYKQQLQQDLRLPSFGASSGLRFVYTAMHGVGYPYVSDMMRHIGMPPHCMVSVPEQRDPDPEFSTVSFPNPEEKGALDRAVVVANREGVDLIIANDPDADRFAAAERLSTTSEFYQFTGDELGTIFGAIAFEKAVAGGVPVDKIAMVCSTVSSKFLARLCAVEGCHFFETLTGFKWIMNKALEVAEEPLQLVPVIGYEEALGYGLSLSVPDKDGVSAAAAFVTKAAQLHAEGSSMLNYLDELSRKYGYFASQNSYFRCPEPRVMGEIFATFRTASPDGKTYPTHVGAYRITRIRDVKQDYDSSSDDHKCSFQNKSDDMVTLWLDNGAHITFRGSGTEPKFKYYSEMSHANSKEEAAAELKKVVTEVHKVFIGDRPLQHA